MAQLVFDIGATHLRVGMVDGGRLGAVERTDTPATPKAGVALVAELARTVTGGERITAVAGGVAGSVSDTGFLYGVANNSGWDEYELGAELRAVLGAPVILRNDGEVGALGEANFGAGRGYAIVAYLAGGTGVGTCRIVDRVADKSAFGFSAGHVLMDGDTEFEDRVGGKGLAEKYGMPSTELPREAWDEVATYLARGIYNTMLYWSPHVVVLSGSVFLNEATIDLKKVVAHVEKVNTVMRNVPPIVRGTLGDDAGLYGAMSLLENKG